MDYIFLLVHKVHHKIVNTNFCQNKQEHLPDYYSSFYFNIKVINPDFNFYM